MHIHKEIAERKVGIIEVLVPLSSAFQRSLNIKGCFTPTRTRMQILCVRSPGEIMHSHCRTLWIRPHSLNPERRWPKRRSWVPRCDGNRLRGHAKTPFTLFVAYL